MVSVVQVAHAVKVGDIGECESQAEARVRLCWRRLRPLMHQGVANGGLLVPSP